MEKLCKNCKTNKVIEDFPKSKRYKDGYDYLCKICRNSANKDYRERNKSKVKEARKQYYNTNIEKMREEKRDYYAKNKNAKQQYDVIYRTQNKEKITNYKKIWEKQDRQKIHSRIKRNLRRRIIHVIQSGYKSNSTMLLLGCDINFFLDYLEKQFDENMNWDNYGQYGWHIDHIIPCSAFDLTKEEEQKKCFHYTNLQPLWWSENLKKSKKIIV